MRRLLLAVLITLVSIPAFAAETPKTEEQKTVYAVGLFMARQLSVFSLTPAEFDLVKQGLTDGMAGTKPLVDLNTYQKKVQDLANARRNAQGETVCLDKGVHRQGIQGKGGDHDQVGLVFLSLKEGNGATPAAGDKVKVHYRGTLVDGTEFDSSYQRGEPAEFALNGVIPCWTEGVQMIKPGGKARLVCPAAIAYGERGAGTIPPNATLVFEIELLGVTK